MNTIQFSEKEKEIIRELVNFDFSEKSKNKTNEPQLITLGWFLQNKVYKNPDYQIMIHPKDRGVIWYKDGHRPDAYYYLLAPILLINRLREHNLLFTIRTDDSLKNYTGFLYFGTRCVLNEMEDNDYIYFDSNEKLEKRTGNATWYDENGFKKYQCNTFSFNNVPILELQELMPIITPELKQLVKNNFKTTEQKSLFWTRIAAIASFAAFLVSIIIPHACSTRIDKEQYDGFMKSDTTTRQEINMRLDAIDESTHQIAITKTDTINKIIE